MQKRKLGTQGLEVSSIGLGTMGMTAFYGDFNRFEAEATNIETIGKALELGINFIDTAFMYQSYGLGGGENTTNEELVGKALKKFGRENFVVATKFGIGLDLTNGNRFISGKPDFIREQLTESLRRLDIDHVDLYYMHRMDPSTPIEETMKCLKELVEEGKIKYIGLSECSSSELRRAHAIHPVSAIQMEWSLNTRDIEESIVPVARELGVGIVCYSPLGRGLLTGDITSASVISKYDARAAYPRFAEGSLEKNLAFDFFEIAKRKNVTPAQLSLAWLLSKGDDVVPIPGTKNPARIAENAGAVNIKLTAEEVEEIANSIPTLVGDRYNEAGMKTAFGAREDNF